MRRVFFGDNYVSVIRTCAKTQVLITDVPVTAAALAVASYLNLSCTIKQASFTAGQKQDIDVTVLCSDEQENVNGLPASSEMSLSGNFYRNPAQDALRDAYDNDTVYGFKIIFPSGNGYMFRAEVRQHTGFPDQWCCGCHLLASPQRQADSD
jgi:hypothetical protein